MNWQKKTYYSCLRLANLSFGRGKLKQIRQTKEIIGGFYILSFNSHVADVASDIAKKLRTKNKIIEFRDIFIAATAIANDMPLSTLNIKHFERIDDLELIDS